MQTTAPATPPDHDALAGLEHKLHLVRDRVAAVASGYQTGLYLCGAGGIGKSYTVLRHLDALKAIYVLFNSRMTARGLFMALSRAPDIVHVLEDMERLTRDLDAQGVLRSALWAQPGHERVVTWTTATGGQERFAFRGGVIMLANRPLADLPELRALATRITVMRLEVTDGEIAALMRDLASRGHARGGKRVLQAEACHEIVEHVIAESRAARCALDLRVLVNSYSDYLQWDADGTACDWRDLVSSRVTEAVGHLRGEVDTQDAEAKKAARRQVVREVMRRTADVREQFRLYREQTARSRADFFRRKSEVESGEFDEEATAG
jgi:hypothetical protein